MAKLKETQKLNKTQNKILEITCIECKRSTKQKVLVSAEIDSESLSNDYDFWGKRSYQVIQCLGCETISFRASSVNSEDTDLDEELYEYVPIISESLYPSRSAGRTHLKDTFLLPLSIQRIYEETINAMNNSQPVLTGIGIRAIVETVCKDKCAHGNNLSEKIDALITLGLLTSDSATVLHKIRTLGNDAAHEVKPHKAEQLSLAMDVCEHLLQGVYLLPHYAQQTFK